MGDGPRCMDVALLCFMVVYRFREQRETTGLKCYEEIYGSPVEQYGGSDNDQMKIILHRMQNYF